MTQPVSRETPLRPERGIISVIEGGASEAGGRRQQLEAPPAPKPGELVSPRNYDTALNLLECAARALEILYDRREQLEASLDDVSKQAEGAVVAAQVKVLDWQRLAASLKSDAQELGRQLIAMQQRAELAETQLEAERARADGAEEQVFHALGLSQGLHSKILSSFGQGSTAHKAVLLGADERQAG